MKEIIINNKVVDFLQASNVRHKVSPGCSQYQDQGDDQLQGSEDEDRPCSNGRHRCRNGAKCIPKQKTSAAVVPYGMKPASGKTDMYECRCTDQFEGKFCDQRRKYNLALRNI